MVLSLIRDLGAGKLSLDIEEIKVFQNNAYPMLFIDKIIEVVPGNYAIGLKNFTYNEWFFPSHFPDEPNVPGFIQIECLVQVFLMSFLSQEEYRGMKTNFVSINEIRFRKKITPGDQLEIHAQLLSLHRGIAKGKAVGRVDRNIVVTGEFVVAIPEVLNRFRP
jgi:3-hydroxyacyl-[acyl-carrier-protein] dehydratase